MARRANRIAIRASRLFALSGIVALAFAFFSYACGARINRTTSLPKGLYWSVNKTPGRGDNVAFWPDGSEPFRLARARGYILPGVYNKTDGVGYGLMLKRLLGLPGDTVSITDNGVIVNGELLPNTRPLACDNIGDPMPVVRIDNHVLEENEVLFISDHLPLSYDSRYFGIQDMRQIVEVVVPVYLW